MPATTDALIDALLAARRDRRPAAAAVFAQVLRTADDADLVQAAVANELGWHGDAPPRHWKSGGASRTATMVHSALPPAGVWPTPAELNSWPFRLGGIEAEIALRTGRDVDAALARLLDVDSASDLIDAMTVSIELVDSRWDAGFEAPALLRLADLQSHSALVLGNWVPYVRRDWFAQRCRVTLGDEPSREYVGTHSCGDPAWVLPEWLRHATQDGQVVPAGTVVTTGTWCGVLTASLGQRVVVEFDGIGGASIQL